jgi:hypothetical protein
VTDVLLRRLGAALADSPAPVSDGEFAADPLRALNSVLAQMGGAPVPSLDDEPALLRAVVFLEDWAED